LQPHRVRLGDQMLSAPVYLKCNEHVEVYKYDAQIIKCETEIWQLFELLTP